MRFWRQNLDLYFIIFNLIMSKSETYQISDIEKIYINIANNKANPHPQQFKDQLTLISRMLVWDDQNASDIFDFVCEVKMFDALLQVFSKSRDKQIINAVIGFFTTLLSNLARQPTLNYLLSHPCIAGLQLTKFGNMNNEVADYYINFLKVLSRKMTVQNLNLFFNRRYPNFALLAQSSRFFNHPQNLVRTTSRNIVLTISQLKDFKVDQFMSGFPFVCYYVHECNFIKEYWTIIDSIIHSEQDNRYELDNLQTLIQDHQQILIFIDDLLNLKQQGVTDKFCDAFINECLSPLVVALDSDKQEGFSIKLILFVLAVLFKNINNQFILNTLSLVVFGKYYTKNIIQCLFNPVDRLLSYDKKWKFKGFWDSHEEKINQYCITTYHSSSILLQNSKKEEESMINNLTKKIDTFSVFGVTNNFYQRQIQKIQQIFNISIFSRPNDMKRPNGSATIHNMLDEILSPGGLELSQCQINPTNEAIQSYFTSKDDSLMMLTLNLLSTFFQNKSITPEVTHFCKLNLKPKGNDFQSIIKIEKIIINCIKIFQVDPPCYRVCTYVEAQQLAKRLVTLYDSPDLPLSKDVIEVLRKALKVAIDRITPYLYGGKQWQKSLQIYQQIQKQLTKRRNKNLKTYGLIPADQSNQKVDRNLTDIIYDEFPKDFHQQIGRDFWIYILIKNLFIQIDKTHSFSSVQMPQAESSNCKYEQGKSYNSIDQQKIEAEYKASSQDKYVGCEIILMSGYFVLVRNNRIQLKSSYEDVLMFNDKSDPRKLLLKHDQGVISLNMFETKLAMSLKKHFQQSKSILLRYRLSQMVKQIETLCKHC